MNNTKSNSTKNKVKRKKVTGTIGRIRLLLMGIGIYFALIAIPVHFVHVMFGENFILIYIMLLILINVIGTSICLIKGNYFIRPINEDEYKNLLELKLIHYTNFLSEDSIQKYYTTGEIIINGNSSARANFNMTWKLAKEKFVWFHQSDKNGNETTFQSFCNAHFTESIPRKYKILIDPIIIDKNLIYIRPSGKNIIILGDFYGKAKLEESFNWYNSKIYIWKALTGFNLSDFVLFFFVIGLQTIGNIRDLFGFIYKRLQNNLSEIHKLFNNN